MGNTAMKVSNKINRRLFIKKAAFGIFGAGAVLFTSKIIVSPPDMGLPDPYPQMPEKKSVIPPFHKKKLFLDEHQCALIATLAAIIIPTGDEFGNLEIGVVDYIDKLMAEQKNKRTIYTQGLKWIDQFSQDKYGSGKVFLNLGLKQQIDLLRLIDESHVMRHRSVSNILHRIHRKINVIWDDMFGAGKHSKFFSVIRRDVLAGYFSNPLSWKDIGYYGPPQPNGYPNFSNPPDSVNYSDPVRFVDNISCRVCHNEGKHPRGGLIDQTCTTCHRPHSPWQYDQEAFYLEDHVSVVFSNPDRKKGIAN